MLTSKYCIYEDGQGSLVGQGLWALKTSTSLMLLVQTHLHAFFILNPLSNASKTLGLSVTCLRLETSLLISSAWSQKNPGSSFSPLGPGMSAPALFLPCASLLSWFLACGFTLLLPFWRDSANMWSFFYLICRDWVLLLAEAGEFHKEHSSSHWPEVGQGQWVTEYCSDMDSSNHTTSPWEVVQCWKSFMNDSYPSVKTVRICTTRYKDTLSLGEISTEVLLGGRKFWC